MKITTMLRKHCADDRNEQSAATQLRRRRFQILLDMMSAIPVQVKILDIGGRLQYWQMMTAGMSLAQEFQVTLLNVKAQEVSHPNFTAFIGDGRALPKFADQQFDIVFSNPTIEHVGDFPDQQRMAREVRRIRRQYYVQTPNRYFPIEPHFLFPLFQIKKR